VKIRRSAAIPGLIALCALAAAPVPEKKPFTAHDMWAVERVGAPVVSPDGKSVAYVVSVYDAEQNRLNGDVWVSPVSGGQARRITTDKASDGSPAWSPDGRRLAFVSKREGDAAAQLYLIPVDGGEAQRITEMPLAVSNPKWLPDGKRVAFVSHVIAGAEKPEETRKALEAREKNKVKARATENRLYRYWDRWLTDEEYPHIFVVDVESKRVTDLLPGSKRYFDLQEGTGSYDVSPDGATIAFEANSEPQPYRKLNRDIFTVATSGGEPKNLTSGNPAEDTDPVFSPDGRTIAYGMERKPDGWPDRTRLALLDLASGQSRALTEDQDFSSGNWTSRRTGARSYSPRRCEGATRSSRSPRPEGLLARSSVAAASQVSRSAPGDRSCSPITRFPGRRRSASFVWTEAACAT
jgi:Tol biopolymer transport system component